MSFSHDGIVLGAGEGKTISVLGNSYTYKAAKEETGGAYALIEHTVVGDGPPPHIHTAEEIAGPPDLEKIKALAPKYNLKIVGPVLRRRAGIIVKAPAAIKLKDFWSFRLGDLPK